MSKVLKFIHSLGLIGSFRLSLDLAFSKILFPSARVVRRPFYIRNEGKLDIGRGFSSGPGLIIDIFGRNAKVEIGESVMAYHNLHIGSVDSVIIGNRVLIASGVYISDHSHGSYSGDSQSSPLESPAKRSLISSPVRIGDDVWLGEKVSILPGVTIGDGVIIGAGSIVTKNIPSYTIAAGIPAVVIKTYNFEEGAWMSLSKCEN